MPYGHIGGQVTYGRLGGRVRDSGRHTVRRNAALGWAHGLGRESA